jgi:hypothetical protein
MPVVVEVVRALKDNGLVISPEKHVNQLMPGSPPEDTPLKSVLDAVRKHEGKGHGQIEMIDPPDAVQSVIDRIDTSVSDEIGSMTLKDFSEAS